MRLHTFAFALVLAFTSFAGCAAEPGTVVDASGGSASALSGRPYFEAWQTSSQHYFHFVAANHEVLLGSEGYTTRTLALKGLLSVLDNGQLPGRFRTQQATNGQWYFTLRASNGEILATSELYAQRSNADQGVSAVIASCAAYEAWLADRTGARFDIFRGADGRHYYNLHAANGEIVLRSQAYSSEAAALNGAFSVKDHGVSATRYDVRQATNGQWYFNVTAANGQVIGTSELYVTRYNAERARDSIIALLPSIEML